ARPRFAGEFGDRGDGAAFRLTLLDDVVVIGEAGDLRKVRHAEHLVAGRDGLQPPADALCRPAADTGIDFVEDQRRRRRFAWFADGLRLQRKSDAGQFATGCDAVERLRLLADVRRKQELNGVETVRGPRGLAEGDAEARPLHGKGGQFALDLAFELLCRFAPR